MVFKQLFDITPRKAAPLTRAEIEPGLYHYMREVEGTGVRFHLRVDSTGNGLLLANAATAARLRASGVVIAKGLLDGDDDRTIATRLRKCFRGVSTDGAAADIDRVRGIIAALETPGDNYPIINLTDPALTEQEAPLDRPLSADVPMAGIDSMRPILERLWDLGIPHVTLVAGPDPNAEELVLAVERAEDLGLITGVRGRGSMLAQGTLIADLAAAGLDHLDVTLLSYDEKVHDALTAAGDHAKAVEAIRAARENDVCPVAEIPLVAAVAPTIDETIEWLVEQGVGNAAIFAIATTEPASPEKEQPSDGPVSADALPRAAHWIDETADEHGLRLLCYPTVRHDPGKPLAEQIAAGPRTSGDSAVRVEADGSAIPARGPYTPAGNLLADDWPAIRRGEVFQRYLRQLELDPADPSTDDLARAAFCPRDPSRWAEPPAASQ